MSLISLQVAKLAKAKGYNPPSGSFYWKGDLQTNKIVNRWNMMSIDMFVCTSMEELHEWFLEKGILVSPGYNGDEYYFEIYILESIHFPVKDWFKKIGHDEKFSGWYEALEIGLYEALKLL